MIDNDAVGLWAVDNWGWVKLDNANRFEVRPELKEGVLLS